jgi:hypothetical protein
MSTDFPEWYNSELNKKSTMQVLKEFILFSTKLRAFVKVVLVEGGEYFCQTAPCGFSKIKQSTFDRMKNETEELYNKNYRDDI